MTICAAGALCYAQNWTGKLIDAACYDDMASNKTSTNSDRTPHGKLDKECAPTASTTSFAIQTSKSTVYKLDAAGSAKASEALKAGSLKSDNDGDVHASVAGTREGNTIKVDSIQGKKGH